MDIDEIVSTFHNVHSGDLAPEDRVRSLGYGLANLTLFIEKRLRDIQHEVSEIEDAVRRSR